MTDKEKILYQEIDKIIWNDWDAIGVNEIEDARDEYYAYLPTIFKYLKEGKSVKELSDYLYHTATINMGLNGNRELDNKVAEKLFNLKK